MAITLFGEPQTIEPCPKICPRTPAGQLAHRLHRLMGDRRGPALPPWSGQVVNHGSQLFTRDAEHHLAAGLAAHKGTPFPREPNPRKRSCRGSSPGPQPRPRPRDQGACPLPAGLQLPPGPWHPWLLHFQLNDAFVTWLKSFLGPLGEGGTSGGPPRWRAAFCILRRVREECVARAPAGATCCRTSWRGPQTLPPHPHAQWAVGRVVVGGLCEPAGAGGRPAGVGTGCGKACWRWSTGFPQGNRGCVQSPPRSSWL